MFKARVENFVFLPLDGGDLTTSATPAGYMLCYMMPSPLTWPKPRRRAGWWATAPCCSWNGQGEVLAELVHLFYIPGLVYVDLTPCPPVGFNKCCFDWMVGKVMNTFYWHVLFRYPRCLAQHCPGRSRTLMCPYLCFSTMTRSWRTGRSTASKAVQLLTSTITSGNQSACVS